MSEIKLNSLILNSGAKLIIEDEIFYNEFLLKKHLMNSIMKKSIFNDITFDRIKFPSVVFSQSEVNKCKFNKSSLSETELYTFKFQNCIFIGSAITSSNFEEASFYFCQFEESSLFDCSLQNCKIIDAEFKNIKFSELDLTIENSMISKENQSLNFFGEFDFGRLLEFLDSD